MEKILEKSRREDARRSWAPETLPQTAAAELRERFDRGTNRFAGLSGEREEYVLLFLLEYARRAEDDWARGMAEAALERRQEGGPLLALAHLEAYAQTGRALHRETARRLLDRALAERRLPGGGFAGAEDGAVSVLWNAQMILALAKACRVLGDGSALQAAREARLFLKTRLTQGSGRLWRRWRNRTPMEEGRLADCAFYCWALADLYETEFAVSCLREAQRMAERMEAVFRDRRGGFYDLTDAYGGGAAALALSRLAQLTGQDRCRDLAREQLAWLSEEGALDGLALLAAVEALYPRRTLLCACGELIPEWLAQAGEAYRLAPLAKTPGCERGLANAAPFTGQFPLPEAGERLYLCRDGECVGTAEDLPQLCRLSPEGAAV